MIFDFQSQNELEVTFKIFIFASKSFKILFSKKPLVKFLTNSQVSLQELNIINKTIVPSAAYHFL